MARSKSASGPSVDLQPELPLDVVGLDSIIEDLTAQLLFLDSVRDRISSAYHNAVALKASVPDHAFRLQYGGKVVFFNDITLTLKL